MWYSYDTNDVLESLRNRERSKRWLDVPDSLIVEPVQVKEGTSFANGLSQTGNFATSMIS